MPALTEIYSTLTIIYSIIEVPAIVGAAIGAIYAIRQNSRTHKELLDFSRAQFVFGLRQTYGPIYQIDSKYPKWEDVRNTANAMEEICLMWKLNVGSREAIEILYQNSIVQNYEAIWNIKIPDESSGDTGKELLEKDFKIFKEVYEELKPKYKKENSKS